MPLPAIISVGGVLVGSKIGQAVVSRVADAIKGKSRGAQVLSDNEVIRIQGGETLTQGRMFSPGADIDIQSQGFAPGTKFQVDPATGEITILKRRRRRKRLLTCGDKADIAFIRGTLGQGALAQGAITSLLNRCG